MKDSDLRAFYDESGEIPDQYDDDIVSAADNPWQAYFEQIFGKVTTSEIDAFSAKYKCSDEERRDVLAELVKRKGNLMQMLDCVMLSEPRDAQRG